MVDGKADRAPLAAPQLISDGLAGDTDLMRQVARGFRLGCRRHQGNDAVKDAAFRLRSTFRRAD
jgi:hypothetical protein